MASGSDGISPPPNPTTPLVFLPPDLAYQLTITTYLFVGATAVLVWDILNNLQGDYTMLFRQRIRWPTIAYLVSRLATLGFVLGTTIFTTAPVGNCEKLQIGVNWLYPIATPATSLLFFFRVRAFFEKNRYAVGFFAFMWLAVLGACLTVTQGIKGTTLGPTKYCINDGLASYVAAAAIIPLVNDTLVFFAITWKLMRNSHRGYTIKEGVRAFVFGEYLQPFSRALMQDGQIYYLTTVSVTLLTLVVFYQTSIPAAYRTMFTLPNLMLFNIMACRVFRNTKLALKREPRLSTATESVVLPLPVRSGIKFVPPSKDSRFTGSGSSAAVIEATKTTHTHDDFDLRVNDDYTTKIELGSLRCTDRMV